MMGIERIRESQLRSFLLDTKRTELSSAVGNPAWEIPQDTLPASGTGDIQNSAAVAPGCCALAYNETVTFTVSAVSPVCGSVRSVLLLIGARTYPLDTNTDIYTRTLPTQVLLGDAHEGIFSYAFAVVCAVGLRYLLWDRDFDRVVVSADFDTERQFSCTVFRRFFRTPDWLHGGVLLVPPPSYRESIIDRLPEYAADGVSCIAPYNAPQDSDIFYLPDATEERKRLIDAAAGYDIGILGLIDFSDERAGILTVCHHAEALLTRGCAGFFFRGLSVTDEGFFRAFCHHIRRLSETCVLLGDEEAPIGFLTKAMLDCRMDIALSEALLQAAEHGNAGLLSYKLAGIYRRYPPEIRNFLPIICSGKVPDWMRILQFTLPGIPTLLEEAVPENAKHLGVLRREHPALCGSGIRFTAGSGGLMTFIRFLMFSPSPHVRKKSHLVIAVNLSSEPETLCITQPVRNLISGRAHAIAVPVPPQGGVILQNL